MFPCKLFNEIIFQLWFYFVYLCEKQYKSECGCESVYKRKCVFVLIVMFA